ncbi:MAG: hypothetical protein PVF05_09820 [Gemmatimonadales bacterium]|jgi:hypothetical protein
MHAFSSMTRAPLAALALVLAVAPPSAAQDSGAEHAHDPSHQPAMLDGTRAVAAELPAGQAAFAAIAAVVAALDADPSTDWSKVDVEALRRHLIDMDRVMMESRVDVEEILGGARFHVSGDGETAAAVRRMTLAHAGTLDAMPEFDASASESAGGATLEVRAARNDAATAARIRGLGYAGLLTLGSHHGPHHLMIARGQHPPGH